MRNFIIGLSILFFILSGFVMYKEASLVEETFGRLAKEQEENRAQLEQLETMVAGLEKEKEMAEAEAEKLRVARETRVLAVIGGGVFRSGQIIITEELMNIVNEIVPEILASPEHILVIEGHTDNIPIKGAGRRYKDNMELSFVRAKAVARVLAENGAPSDRVTVASYGETRPIASNDTPEGRAKNRRVVVKLVPRAEEN
jgi:chemotaxis protein MotB